jgi:O-antigen/teichoic acid export membrane protein
MEIKINSDIKSLLFKNIGLKQTILKNTFWLTIGDAGSRFLKLILFIYVARILGATEYGKFAFALSFVLLFQIFVDLGLNQIIVREFSKEEEKERDFSSLISLKIFLGTGVLILILILSLFITSDPSVRIVIWILAISNIISDNFLTFYAFLRARQKMEYEGIIRIFEALLLAGLGFTVLFYFPSIINLSYSYLFASLFSLIIILLFFHFKIQKLSPSWNKLVWKNYLLMSWPLALISLSYIVYNRIDSVMMGYLGQITQTGWYNAALRIVAIVTIPMAIISGTFYPVLSKASMNARDKLQKIWNYHTSIMIWLALPIMTGGIVLASKIIDYIYNPTFNPAVLAFQILVVMAGIMFFYNSLRWILIVVDQQKKLFWAVISGAIINIILNLILIPKFSLYGAALATVITHLIIFFLLLNYVLKFTPINPFNTRIIMNFIGAILSSVVMYLVIIQPSIYQLNVLLIIIVGMLVYSICLFGYEKLSGKILEFYYANN